MDVETEPRLKQEYIVLNLKMALVSYGSSDESDLSENEDEVKKDNLTDIVKTNSNTNSTSEAIVKDTNVCDVISDEEDLPTNQPDDATDSIFDENGVSHNDSCNSLFSSLPSLQKVQSQDNSNGSTNSSKNHLHIDENEDLNTIPKHKVYKGETLELKPKKKEQASIPSPKIPNKSLKKAPVRIMAPSLLTDRDIEDNGPPRKILAASSKKSGLLGLLPKPKGLVIPPTKNNDQKPVEPPTPKASNNSFVPRSVSRKPQSKTPKETAVKKKLLNKDTNDSDDESDSEPTSFFTLEDKPLTIPSTPTNNSSSIDYIKSTLEDQPLDSPNMHPSIPENYDPDASASNSYPKFSEEVNYSGEAIAPYPPAGPSYPQSQDLMDNTEALERLAGRIRKGRGGQNKVAAKEIMPDNIIEVNQGDLTADPSEWMTKALTQDDNAPGPRCNIGGQTKRKHQLTYLAAMAKQNENELKKQWAENSQSRRAHQSKYGF